jgi:hypothetical protein
MRSYILVLCAMLIAMPLSSGQSSTATDNVLEIRGIELRLGMDESAVLQKVASANLDARELSAPDKGTWLLCDSPDDRQCDIGSVTFEKGKLVLVSRTWRSTRDAFTLASSILGAAKDLERRGYTHCELRTDETFDPLGEIRSVVFRCGPMKLSILSSGGSNKGFVGKVWESLSAK